YAELGKRQVKIQDQIRVIEGHIEASPMVELQLKELTRNYDSALAFYNDLLKKRDNSAMARDLVHQQEGEQVRVLDPPSLPTGRSVTSQKRGRKQPKRDPRSSRQDSKPGSWKLQGNSDARSRKDQESHSPQLLHGSQPVTIKMYLFITKS